MPNLNTAIKALSLMLATKLADKSTDYLVKQLLEAADRWIKQKSIMTNWIPTTTQLPQIEETVWLANLEKQWVWLGCRADTGDGWLWAESNGTVYAFNGKIVAECEADDDYDVTHWYPLPRLTLNDTPCPT